MSKKEAPEIKKDINIDVEKANSESSQSDSILNDTEEMQEVDDDIEKVERISKAFTEQMSEFAEEVEDKGSEAEEHRDNSWHDIYVDPIISISRWTLQTLAEELLRLNIGAMTPLEALEFLSRWYSTLYSSRPRRGLHI